MDILLFLIVGVVIGGFVGGLAGASSDADDWEPSPPKRREPDLFSLAVGVALGAALFGDDDE